MKKNTVTKNILWKFNFLSSIFFTISLFMFLIFTGCEKKVENPVNIQKSISEWTCVDCHTDQEELASLADYMVGGDEEEDG